MRSAAVLGALAAGCGHVHFTASPDVAANDWWDASWPYRQPITFDHVMVQADLADFPVLVTTASDPALAAHAANGRIAFTDDANHELAFELEAFAPTLVAWVKVPALSSTADTTIYLYYGDATAPDQAQPAQVWTNGFAGVYHFGDGTTLDVHDSTDANDAMSEGATAAPGQILGAASFAGSADIVAPTAGLDTSPGAVATVTLWLYFEPPFDAGPVVFVGPGGAVYDLWFEADGCEGFNTGNGEVLGTTASALANQWLYVAAEFFNGTPRAAGPQPGNALYLDAVAQALSFSCSPGTPNAVTAYATLDWGGNPGYYIHGVIDEGRFALGARDAAWIATEYANQGAPATFETFGPEQSR